jgi:hypothetical protein
MAFSLLADFGVFLGRVAPSMGQLAVSLDEMHAFHPVIPSYSSANPHIP